MRKRFSRLATAASLGAAVIIICFSLLYWQPTPMSRLNNLIYDTWMRLSEKPPVHNAPVIVDIYESSLKKLGQWPWPRTLLGDLVEKILEDGAAAVGLDILLAEPDRTSPAFLGEELKNAMALNWVSIKYRRNISIMINTSARF